MPQPVPARSAFVVRTVLWIIISTVFLIWNARRISLARAAGLHITPWAYLQLAIWCLALVFWLYTGWRDWTRRVP